MEIVTDFRRNYIKSKLGDFSLQQMEDIYDERRLRVSKFCSSLNKTERILYSKRRTIFFYTISKPKMLFCGIPKVRTILTFEIKMYF